MTTIILVIVGVLLAAAAALMMYFYGGGAFNESTAEAEAATLITHGTQINAAFDLYRTEKGKLPGDADGSNALRDLVDEGYLSQIPPHAGKGNYEPGWKVDYERGIARTTIGDADDNTSQLICKKARTRLGLSGEPKLCSDASIEKIDPCCIMSASDL